MLTKEDFLKQYSASTDEELYKMYVTIDDYAGEAKEAIDLEIQRRGGIDVLKNNLRQKQETLNEEIRIQEEAGKLYVSGSDAGLIKKMINSSILTREEVEELIDNKIIQIQHSVEDQKIKPRTIFGSLIGGTIASLIGGVLWGLQLIQMHRMFVILGIGMALLSYGIIKFSTKQSKENIIVLIATLISTGAAIFIGQLIFEAFGRG